MDPTEAALLAAIAALPDEDTPRLAFADHLDERAGPADAARAEFIRVQVELTGLPAGHRARARLTARAADLWVVNRRAWRALMPAVPGVGWRGFDRGFYTALDADRMDQFVRGAAGLFAAAPVRSVRILEAHPNVTGALAALPELGRLHELDLTACRGVHASNGYEYWTHAGVLTDADAAALAASPGVVNLRVLRLGGNRIGAAGARALAAAPHFRHLRRLDLNAPESAVGISRVALDALRRAMPAVDVR